jgi:hypothetical protein
MSTLTLKQKALSFPAVPASLKYYNKYSLLSLSLATLFVLYFIMPHGGVFHSVFSLSIFYILVLPFLTLILSVMAIRQIYRTNDRGIVLSYIALGITGLYFMVALAVPLVLIGLYIIYSLIL